MTMTGVERQWALISALRYLDRGNIPGDIVECGVWRGGNMMIAKHLSRYSHMKRAIYLYDTFSGMSEPTTADSSYQGEDAVELFEKFKKPTHTEWCYASLEEVRSNFESAGLLDEQIRFIKGKVEDTLRDGANVPDRIALLRLDTDFYESTKSELETLYPRLVKGGVLIVDDYGYWRGAKLAVDEYFEKNHILWLRIDRSARMTVK
jgi:O-methyltransferase